VLDVEPTSLGDEFADGGWVDVVAREVLASTVSDDLAKADGGIVEVDLGGLGTARVAVLPA
jgi:hypothetical protein